MEQQSVIDPERVLWELGEPRLLQHHLVDDNTCQK